MKFSRHIALHSVIAYFLLAGASLNCRCADTDQTALEISDEFIRDVASSSPRLGDMFTLLKIGGRFLDGIPFHVNTVDKIFKSTPLQLATEIRHTQAIKTLLACGADINTQDDDGLTSISYALIQNNSRIVQFLIDNGADINIKNKLGNSPLHHAIIQKNVAYVKFILQYQPDIGQAHGPNNLTPLHLAVLPNIPSDISFQIAKLLVDHGADVDAKDSLGRTPIMLALDDRKIEVVKLLAQSGANISIKDPKQDKTLIQVAGQDKNNKDLVRFLAETLVKQQKK